MVAAHDRDGPALQTKMHSWGARSPAAAVAAAGALIVPESGIALQTAFVVGDHLRTDELVRVLKAYDPRPRSAVADIVRAMRGREVAGALAVGLGSAAGCVDVVGACKGVRFVAMATPATSFDDLTAGPRRALRLIPAIARMLAGTASLTLQARRRGVKTKMIWGSTLIGNEVGPMIFEAFLPAALAEGRFVTAPAARVVGAGLAELPHALERQRRGVSAAKLFVTL